MGSLLVFSFFAAVLLGRLGFLIYAYVYPDSDDESLIKISSEELISEYTSDEKAARLKYKNKFLELTGRISYIHHNGQEYVMILNEAFECYFKYANFPLILSENTEIKIRGVFFDDGKKRGLKRCSATHK